MPFRPFSVTDLHFTSISRQFLILSGLVLAFIGFESNNDTNSVAFSLFDKMSISC